MGNGPDAGGEQTTLVGRLTAELEDQERRLGAIHAERMVTLAGMFEASETLDPSAPGGDAEMKLRSIAAEAGAALRVGDRTMQRRLWDAWCLVHEFPATFASLAAGRISVAHTVEIQHAAIGLDCVERAAFEDRAVQLAEVETPTRLKRMLSVIAEQVRPTSLAERHREARKARAVFVRDLPDGMGELVAILPAVLAHGCLDRLSTLAHEVRKAATAPAPSRHPETGLFGPAPVADDRTMDQIRADAFADLILSGTLLGHGEGLAAIHANVQVTIPLHTLAGLDDEAPTLAGWGPVDPDTVRDLAATAAGWDRVITDPVTGMVLTVDRYRPSEAMRRALRVRDERCRFPGCGQPVSRCDIDHTHDAADGGPTSIDNLAHLRRRHHSLKHESAWKVKQLGGGLLEWTSPTHRVYIDTPPRTLTFEILDDDPPWITAHPSSRAPRSHPPGSRAPSPAG